MPEGYDNPCKNCSQKLKTCRDCVFVLQSPLERKLFIALKEGIPFQLQARIHKDSTIHSQTTAIDKEIIRTILDFLFTTQSSKTVCVYADERTYHGRMEYQALRDRSIDRDVQLFDYTVLRFTGKEINTNLSAVVHQIKQFISN